MKFVIACDLEGIAGIVGKPGQGLGMQGKQYDFLGWRRRYCLTSTSFQRK